MYPRNLDADDGFLESGVLQVAEGTRLLIDETVLQEGKLGESGKYEGGKANEWVFVKL